MSYYYYGQKPVYYPPNPYGYRENILYPYYRNQPKIAYANVKGGPLAPNLEGTVVFMEVPSGTEVFAEFKNLPEFRPAKGDEDPIGPHGFHLHESGNCEVGDPKNPFQAAGGHWNPTNQPHGNHAGDFPVLFSNNGFARMSFFTNKFTVDQIVGKAVIVHQNPDDFRSQPAGDAGKRLACGKIQLP